MKQNKRVTRQDVADKAEVSTATVSYVVNDGPRSVAPKTRARVLKVIEELGYYPNDLARSLRINQTATVGLVIPDLGNPFYANLARDVEEITFSQGYALLVCNANRELAKELRFAKMLRSKQVDAVIFLPDSDSLDAIFVLRKANIPVVVLERQDVHGLHCVEIDDFQGGVIATNHLLQMGHRRIGFLRQANSHTTSRQRIEGYFAALEAAQIAVVPDLIVDCTSTPASGAEAMATLLSRFHDLTAVIAHNDVIALGALHAIHEAGLTVPSDISIVGYDNIDAAAYYHPPLTTVRYPSAAVARAAAKHLFAMLDSKARHESYEQPSVDRVPVDLVLRQSTGPVRPH